MEDPPEIRQLKSEERRALILLGVTAVIATVWAALWTKAKTPSDYVWNFPTGYPIPHLTVYVIPVLETLIWFWIGYAFFAFWYFAVDWFPGRKGTILREVCHIFAMGFLSLYPVLFVWLVLSAWVSFLIPGWTQTIFWSVALAALAFLLLGFLVFAVGRRRYDQYDRLMDKVVGYIFHQIRKTISKLFEAFKDLIGRIRKINWVRKRAK